MTNDTVVLVVSINLYPGYGISYPIDPMMIYRLNIGIIDKHVASIGRLTRELSCAAEKREVFFLSPRSRSDRDE